MRRRDRRQSDLDKRRMIIQSMISERKLETQISGLQTERPVQLSGLEENSNIFILFHNQMFSLCSPADDWQRDGRRQVKRTPVVIPVCILLYNFNIPSWVSATTCKITEKQCARHSLPWTLWVRRHLASECVYGRGRASSKTETCCGRRECAGVHNYKT